MRYSILGATEAHTPRGEPVPLGGPRLRALLAALALRADRAAPVPTGTLIEDVWADQPPADAPAALQALVGRLRRALGREAVGSAPGGYRLRVADPGDVDLHRFEQLARAGERAAAVGDPATAATMLREALALWRGPALADLPPGPSAARAGAARAESRRHAARCGRLAAELARGPAAPLLPELRELAAAHPLDEPAQALLLRALRDAGRPAEALDAYAGVRARLADQLGTDPGPELTALHAELLSPTPAPRSARRNVAGDGRGSGTGNGPGNAAGNRLASAPARVPANAPTGPVTPTSPTAPTPLATPATPATPEPPPGNIRPRLTSFVGRESELATLRADLAHARLITLTGPGGSGKTRLAEHVATHLPARDHPDGAWLAELAPLEHPAAVAGAALAAVPGAARASTPLRPPAAPAARDAAGPHQERDATARLVEYCAERRLLLVLDNCEHVVSAAATLAETLLAHCPHVTVLATSREPLGVPGELVRPVEPLPPAPAHQLFVDRGAAPGNGLDAHADAHAAAVAEICRRLDGLPLAIELAAARLRSLTPRQIADRLDDRFRLLSSGSRTALPRQQTLRAVVDWSWELLTDVERGVLRRLAVFQGGCTLEAAEAVCADGEGPDGEARPDDARLDDDAPPGNEGPDAVHPAPPVSGRHGADRHGADRHRAAASGRPVRVPRERVLDALAALVDKSILIAEHPAPPPSGDGRPPGDHPAAEPDDPAEAGVRYRMLETIHEYAAERAAEHPAERAAAEARHTAQVGALLRAAEPRLRTADQLRWLARIDADLGNVRAALRRAVQAGDRATAERLVLDLGWYWFLRNHRAEGVGWIEDVLALHPDADDAPFAEGDPAPTDPAQLRRLELRMLSYFLFQQERLTPDQRGEPGPSHARRVLAAFGDPTSARPADSLHFPALLWPFAAFLAAGIQGAYARGYEDALRNLDVAVARCRQHGGDWELALLLLFQAHLTIDLPRGGPTAAHLPELEALTRRVGDRYLLCQTHGLRAEYEVSCGHFATARAEFAAAIRAATELGAEAEEPFFTARMAELAYLEGDEERVERLLERVVPRAERAGAGDALCFAHYVGAQLAVDRGDLDRARELRELSRSAVDDVVVPPMFTLLLDVVGARILLAEGAAPDAAVAAARDALAGGLAAGCAEVLLSRALLALASALAAAERPGPARRVLETCLAVRGGRHLGVPGWREIERVRARTAGAAGEDGPPGAPGPGGAEPLRATGGPGGRGGAPPARPLDHAAALRLADEALGRPGPAVSGS